MEAPERAVWYERTGPAEDVLTFGEQPTPRAGPGQVRVRLAASGVNPADCSRRAGAVNSVMEAPLIIPNSDGAGVIDEIGEGVAANWLGRRVWLYNGQHGGRVDRARRRARPRRNSARAPHRGGGREAWHRGGDDLSEPRMRRQLLQRRVIGRVLRAGFVALLVAAAALLREAGFVRAVLDVYADNLRAVRLYEKLGWHRIGSPRPHAGTGRLLADYSLDL